MLPQKFGQNPKYQGKFQRKPGLYTSSESQLPLP